ncbi:MAG TPA: carbohydrate ABC transporter permease [Spirochaetia bacterium]|nr:carbohydrate ABC transporter permease [Spirochaetia bacterium]
MPYSRVLQADQAMRPARMPRRRTRPRIGADRVALNLIAYVVVGGIAVATFLPFLILLINSFASEHFIINHGYSFFPNELSLSAYELVFTNPQRILRAYEITLFITVFGTAGSLFLSAMAAYAMSRKDLRYRNAIAFFVYFTTLFNGGLAPTFIIITRTLHLQNTIGVLLLGPMFNVLYLIILRNFFMNSIPASLSESAKIDGAGDFTIFVRIVLPLTTSALASIGLFTALAYWNDWWTAMLYIERSDLYPLQYVLYRILSSATMAANIVNNVATLNLPKETLKLAMTVISIGPIFLAYGFVQRFFIKGITIGAIKG